MGSVCVRQPGENEGHGHVPGRARALGMQNGKKPGPPDYCGPACDACFEPAGAVTTTNWAYVGEGKGGYEKMQTFNYVGEGVGSFEREARSPCAVNVRTCCVSMLITTLCVGGAVLFLPQGSVVDEWLFARGDRSTSAASSETERHNCSGVHNGTEADQEHHSASELAWCCKHKAVGCSSHGSQRHSTASDGSSWAPSPAASTTLRPATPAYDCGDGYSKRQHSWSLDKMDWCCKNERRGCPRAATTPAAAYDCMAGYLNWATAWSPQKKEWCCKSESRGCPTTSPALRPAVEPHFAVASTSMRPQALAQRPTQPPAVPLASSPVGVWCDSQCNVEGKTQTCSVHVRWEAVNRFHSETRPCDKAMDYVRGQCSVCSTCSLVDTGCRSEGGPAMSVPQGLAPVAGPTTKAAFNCQEKLSQAVKAWSPFKKAWCCKNKKLGCVE